MALDKEMTFLEHLEELRWHLVRSIVAIVVFSIVAFIFAPWVFTHIIFAPAHADFITFKWFCALGRLTGYEKKLCIDSLPFVLQSRYMSGQFTMHITASLIMGLIVAFPYTFWEIWRFIKPGLHIHERRASSGVVFAVSSLFLIGIVFGYYLLCPLSIYFLATYQISDIIINQFDITSYVSTVTSLVLGCGLIFELPVVVYFLTKIGILSPSFLRYYRKHAIIVILVIAAVVTPPDPFSMIIVAVPLYALFEMSIYVSAYVARKKAREDEEWEKSSS